MFVSHSTDNRYIVNTLLILFCWQFCITVYIYCQLSYVFIFKLLLLLITLVSVLQNEVRNVGYNLRHFFATTQ
jgi:hypothetical protein